MSPSALRKAIWSAVACHVLLNAGWQATAFAPCGTKVGRRSWVQTAGSARPSQRRTTAAALWASSREEEIAQLEAQLRKLRQEEGESTSSTDGDAEDAEQQLTAQEAKISRRLEQMKGKDMLLSESELIGDGIVQDVVASSGESNGTGLAVQAAVAIVGLVLLVAFAQVPVGQEGLSQYSATGSSSIQTIDLGDMNPDARSPSQL